MKTRILYPFVLAGIVLVASLSSVEARGRVRAFLFPNRCHREVNVSYVVSDTTAEANYERTRAVYRGVDPSYQKVAAKLVGAKAPEAVRYAVEDLQGEFDYLPQTSGQLKDWLVWCKVCNGDQDCPPDRPYAIFPGTGYAMFADGRPYTRLVKRVEKPPASGGQ